MIFARKQAVQSNLDNQDKLPQLFDALSDRRRFDIMKFLINRNDLCVSQIADVFHITVSAASQQLRLLELAGLIKRVRMGQKICYEIKEDRLVKAVLKVMTEN